MPGVAAPVQPARGVRRLETLKAGPHSVRFDASARSHATRNNSPSAAEQPGVTSSQCCDNPDINDEDGSPVCHNCGREQGMGLQLRSEITFGETNTGAATVQGGFVGEEQRHANTMGGTMRGLGSSMESREKTLWRGKDEIARLVAALRLRQTVNDGAVQLYKQAVGVMFTTGRRVRHVAACCIYYADRSQVETRLLLMDLAEKIQVNIWTLGKVYKDFLHEIILTDPASQPGGEKKPQELEPIVLKFVQRLEFGNDSYKVAQDACHLIARMRRDWMVDGRQPAGIIGAAIILAARMNNFRRTVREVVYVVRVADSTINQRLHEFKRTKASTLSVEQFRDVGLRLKDNDIQPPAIYKRAEREERKRKRLARAAGIESSEYEDEEEGDEEIQVVEQTAASQRPKRAAKRRKVAGLHTPPDTQEMGDMNSDDGFLIPDIPLDPRATPDDAMDFESGEHLDYVVAAAAPEALGDDNFVKPAPKKKRGRPRKKGPAIIVPTEDLEIEDEIQDEMMGLLSHTREWEKIFKEFKDNENHPTLKRAQDTATHLARDLETNLVPDTEEIEEEEFEDDDDIANCVLNPREVAMKERVWITENEEWLREQQQKLLTKELEEASGKPKKVKHKRKRTRMGDGSVLGGVPATSAADAVQKMLKMRAAKFSSHINYDNLKKLGLFPSEEEQAESQGTTPSASAATPAVAQNGEEEIIEINGDADAEGEYEDGYEEQYDEEPIDDPNMYLSDEDVGFENLDDDF